MRTLRLVDMVNTRRSFNIIDLQMSQITVGTATLEFPYTEFTSRLLGGVM